MTPYYVAAVVFLAASFGAALGALTILAIQNARQARRSSPKES